MDFYDFPNYRNLQGCTSILTEENNANEKDIIVKQATISGRVSLITKTFGRGTDFVCRDEKVIAQGGVHVIQTFFSKNLSEEVQIKGRTARQGDKGSYSIILLDKEIEYFMGTEQLDLNNKGKLYEVLNGKRNAKNIDEYQNNKKFIKNARAKHAESINFLKSLEDSDHRKIAEYLKKENIGPTIWDSDQSCRTLILMDATGSMSALLEKSKTTVFEMTNRMKDILAANKLTSDCFCLQFAVYRNYNSDENQILEHSPWETKPNNLWAFMSKISVQGGWGNEAIEIALFHANNEANSQLGVSQIILIGDAPANSNAEIDDKQTSSFGKNYWKGGKFAKATNYKEEMKKLKNKKIKIHAFYVDPRAQTNFQEIATFTGGNQAFLNVNDPVNGAEMLTNLVSEEVLRNVGEKHGGIGEDLVKCYRKAYIANK